MADRNRDVTIRIDKAPKPWPLAAGGQPIPVFAALFEPAASRRQLSAQEAVAAQQPVAQQVCVYNIRDPWPDITITPDEQFRLVDLSDGGRVYDIRRIDKIGRRAELDIYAEARAEAVAA